MQKLFRPKRRPGAKGMVSGLSVADSRSCRLCGIDLFHAETDTVEFALKQLPADLRAFADDVYEFRPDIVEQGVGSVDVLVKEIKDRRQVLLWWD